MRYIQESIRRIERYTRGGKEAFLRDEMVQDAVLRRLETLADATHRLQDEPKARHAHSPWEQIYRFRTVAAHAYETIDLPRIWEVVERHIPPLKQAIAAEIKSRPRRKG